MPNSSGKLEVPCGLRIESKLSRDAAKKKEDSEVQRHLVKYKDYIDINRSAQHIRDHQVSALNRAVEEGILTWSADLPDGEAKRLHPFSRKRVNSGMQKFYDDAMNYSISTYFVPKVERAVKMSTSAPSESQETPTENRPTRRLRGYELSLKREVINHAMQTNISLAARTFNVPRSCVQDWLKNKDAILDEKHVNMKFKRRKGAGRPLKDRDFDERLIGWVREEQEKGVKVSRRMIQQQAREMGEGVAFAASNGWLQKFMLRHNLTKNTPREEACETSEPSTSETTDAPVINLEWILNSWTELPPELIAKTLEECASTLEQNEVQDEPAECVTTLEEVLRKAEEGEVEKIEISCGNSSND
uniref:HTH CENPB-type domain-containing protein n=1 Tax=Caenorhabditis japonica TaxID=281687 RepID=A0A8R1HQP3_CAEJA